MNYADILNKLSVEVPSGKVTTYKELSMWAYEHPKGTQAIVSMLKAAVNDDSVNAILTNRVVPESGRLADPNGQITQLSNEGVPIVKGVVTMQHAKVVRFSNDS